jgi:threonine dehydrogenase-like Zn-dependent dehydrogenase
MRVAVFEEAGKPFRIERQPDPAPADDEVVIRVHRCGICGSDVSMTAGGPFDFPAGMAMGHEYAGEVVAVGRGVSDFGEGDRVTGMAGLGCGQCRGCREIGNPVFCEAPRLVMGAFGEYMRLPQRAATHLPAAASYVEGALVEPVAVALHAIAMSDVGPQSRVLVIGAGAVGLAVIYLLRLRGVEAVVAGARSLQRADIAVRMGAKAFVRLDGEAAASIGATLGGAPDVVFECAGAASALSTALDLVRPRGQIVSLGMCCHQSSVLPVLAAYKETRWLFPVAYTKREFDEAAALVAAQSISPAEMVGRTIALDDLPDTIEAMRRGSAGAKIHVDPWQ